MANGYYDCYGPEGDWAETGYWGGGDTWGNGPGYYDDEGNWGDEDPPVEEEEPAPPPAVPLTSVARATGRAIVMDVIPLGRVAFWPGLVFERRPIRAELLGTDDPFIFRTISPFFSFARAAAVLA